MKNTSPINLIAKWSDLDKNHANAYSHGRNAVLRENGFESVISENTSWHNKPNTLLLLAYIKNQAVAGMRIDLYSDEDSLPFVDALRQKFDNIEQIIDKYRDGKIGEIGGVWNAKKISKVNLAHVLARYSLALCPHIGIETAFTFNATYTSKLSSNYGAELVTSLGKEGLFEYPFPPFYAGLWVFRKVTKTISINDHDQERILHLRQEPNANCQSEKELKPLINYKFINRET